MHLSASMVTQNGRGETNAVAQESMAADKDVLFFLLFVKLASVK